jgi:photosystem II stability/assembly factor-like uncharacterized protein
LGYTVSSLYNGTTFNIHKTSDKGETWTDQSSGYTGMRFKDIWIFNRDTVMMCGNYGVVITTFDGGENWIADTVAQGGEHLFGISFSGSVGYVCGNSGAIYKTTDMGTTWQALEAPFITAIEEIFFLDENFGFIAGLNFIYYTEDGGDTWIEPETFPGASLNWWLREISFPTDSIGFVCGDIGQVYKTTDRGKNWEYLPNTLTTESLQAIAALSENNIYACGYAGTVIHSQDGGETWESMSAASQYDFFSIDFTPDGTGYICSWSGEILRFQDTSTGFPDQYPGIEPAVFPNPFRDRISIRPESGNRLQSAEIFDLQGNLLFSTSLNDGDNCLETGKLASGFYFLRILSAKGVTTRKMTRE